VCRVCAGRCVCCVMCALHVQCICCTDTVLVLVMCCACTLPRYALFACAVSEDFPQVTEQSPGSEWYDDLLTIKMFKKPVGSGSGHFWLAVVHVGTKEILLTADGLDNDGDLH
jgi:hypothetical protein